MMSNHIHAIIHTNQILDQREGKFALFASCDGTAERKSEKEQSENEAEQGRDQIMNPTHEEAFPIW